MKNLVLLKVMFDFPGQVHPTLKKMNHMSKRGDKNGCPTVSKKWNVVRKSNAKSDEVFC